MHALPTMMAITKFHVVACRSLGLAWSLHKVSLFVAGMSFGDNLCNIQCTLPSSKHASITKVIVALNLAPKQQFF